MIMNNEKFLLEELSIGSLYNVDSKGDGITYEVPIYQRNYAWEEDQIRTLIQDVYDACQKSSESVYYIGTLVTFDKGDKLYEVIDGQQRLTTIYLVLKVLNVELNSKLTYRSRKRSKDTLAHIPDFDKVENVDAGIRNGYRWAEKAINEIVSSQEEKKAYTSYFLENVHILHYVVPKDVDLNHYFEVMNSRGEQLEKHEIVKAKLCDKLCDEQKGDQISRDNQISMEKFNHIWEACSKMNVFIQQRWGSFDSFKENFDELPYSQDNNNDKSSWLTIREIMDGNIGGNSKENNENDMNDAFQPIIDFPNFLLIVLKITRLKEEDDFKPDEFILDDKELINEFDKIDNLDKDFVKRFIVNLLKAKYLLDNYIVHHANNEDSIGDNPWKLQKWDNNGYTKDLSDNDSVQMELVHLLSMFEVAFTARQRKNYLFYCLLYLFDEGIDPNTEKYLDFLRDLARKYFLDIYLNAEKLNQSNNRPNPNSFDKTILNGKKVNRTIENNCPDFTAIYGDGEQDEDGRHQSRDIQLFVFNYTDYKLWKKYAIYMRGQRLRQDNRKRQDFFDSLGCSDFKLDVFDKFYFSRTRKSLEHFYPQAKVWKDEKLSEANINCFGNYAMISAEANSSGSDWNPRAKLDHYYSDSKQNQIGVASLKFKIMMQICSDNINKIYIGEMNRESGLEWNYDDIVEHQKKMIKILMEE